MKILNGEELTAEELLNRIPKPPDTAVFQLQKVEEIVLPHPYCITPKHLQYNDGMYLTKDSIREAEKKGAKCDICKHAVKKGKQKDILSIDNHEQKRTLFIAIPQETDTLQGVPGLVEYLTEIRAETRLLGIDQFGFQPRRECP